METHSDSPYADFGDAPASPEPKQKCAVCRTQKAHGYQLCCLGFFGLFLIAFAIFIPPWLTDQVNSGLDDLQVFDQQAMDDNNDGWRGWMDTTSDQGNPLTYKVYFFNITNPDDVVNGAAPVVVEVGPYVYSEQTLRYNASFQNDFDGSPMVTTNKWTYYVFDEVNTAPGLSQNDTILSINIVLLTLAGLGLNAALPSLYPSQQYPTDASKLFASHTVYEWAFGFYDPALGGVFPGLVINETQEAATASGFDQWYTGKDENWHIRGYRSWHDHDSVLCEAPTTTGYTEAWDSSIYYDANRVYGTDGDIFRRDLKDGTNLQAFVDVIYREATIVNVDNLHVTFKGIDLLRFVLPANLLQNASTDPINAAFYAFGDTGMLNLTKCSFGAPIFVSKPHFLDVESGTNTTGKIVGLSPNRDEHDTFLDVEPISGITMHAAKRLEINLLTQPVQAGLKSQNITWFSNIIPLLYVPVIWIEEGGEIKDDDATTFKNSVILVTNLNYYLYWIGYIMGFTFVGVAIFGLLFKVWSLSGNSQYKNLNGPN